MPQRKDKDSLTPVPNAELDDHSEARDAIIGEVPSNDDDDDEFDDEEDGEFDESNEPGGDPAKNVPSA